MSRNLQKILNKNTTAPTKNILCLICAYAYSDLSLLLCNRSWDFNPLQKYFVSKADTSYWSQSMFNNLSNRNVLLIHGK